MQGTQRRTAAKFNRGYKTLHQDEIELAADLHKAILLRLGETRAKKVLAESPADAFRSMRYGRRFIDMDGCLCLVVDHPPFFDHKAESRHILTPAVGVRRWRAFAERVRSLSILPRWADGWSAAAEVLDDLGYAIAESIAGMMCWEIEGDEGIIFYERNQSRSSSFYVVEREQAATA